MGVVRVKKLIKAVQKAVSKLNEASCAVQCIEKYLIFKHFNEDTPQVSACNADEIIVEYNGHEIPIDTAIELMEKHGCITPDDFCK